MGALSSICAARFWFEDESAFLEDKAHAHLLLMQTAKDVVAAHALLFEKKHSSLSSTREASWTLNAMDVKQDMLALLRSVCDHLISLHEWTTSKESSGIAMDKFVATEVPESAPLRAERQPVAPPLVQRKCLALQIIGFLTFRNVFLQEVAIKKNIPDIIAALVRTFDTEQPRIIFLSLKQSIILITNKSLERVCCCGDAQHP